MTTRSPILVTGAHRTGTTWVGKMLAASGEAAYISEPTNLLHRPGVLRAPTPYWYTYICEQNGAEYLPALQETLRFRYHTWAELRAVLSAPKEQQKRGALYRKDAMRMGRDWAIFFDGWLRQKRPLLKDPFALFSAPWFAESLGYHLIDDPRL